MHRLQRLTLKISSILRIYFQLHFQRKSSNIINKSSLVRSKVNMTTKELSRKQVIISMSKSNTNVIGSNANFHINSINKHLKDANLNILANFIYIEKISIIITTNQAASVQDISIIKKALKESENINQNFIESSHLLKFKSYLKILGFPYYIKNTNDLITSELVKEVIKESYIFNNITLTSKSWIIKASFHSNSAIIWINI